MGCTPAQGGHQPVTAHALTQHPHLVSYVLTSTRCPARSDEVNLFDPTGKLSATAKWANAEMGTALHVLPGADGSYTALPETADVVALLRATGRHEMFLNALKVCAWPGRREGIMQGMQGWILQTRRQTRCRWGEVSRGRLGLSRACVNEDFA